ncbi:hypothetical protein GOODEAATRI_018772 [Goodea atripinnis]|uniref:Nuclear/hormone receptor activator site AF-1 domain-containing protein n=1 Tax=Goodea atripinnis TaxID=208336 RepID=A0ABV0P5Z5_9TELE
MTAGHTHPPSMAGMVGHPSVISTSRPLPSPMSTLGSPMNGLASPYPVITSSLGSPSMPLQSTPNMNFGPISSPQGEAISIINYFRHSMDLACSDNLGSICWNSLFSTRQKKRDKDTRVMSHFAFFALLLYL